MNRLTLSRIDEELESSEVAALRFLCRDVVNRKRLETVTDAKGLFVRLEEQGHLVNNSLLSQLLETIGRRDLAHLLRTDNRQMTETDANPILSLYRIMLYRIYENMTQENFEKMKFLLEEKLGKRPTEECATALDVFAEMEKKGLLSNTKLNELYAVLQESDQQLAETVHTYIRRLQRPPQSVPDPHFSIDERNTRMSVSETQPSESFYESVLPDSENITKPTSSDDEEYYPLTHKPHGLCLVINNEDFEQVLRKRAGTNEDARALNETFTSLGFDVQIHTNLSAAQMKHLLIETGKRNFYKEDALVVCVLSHGEYGCVFGSDEVEVPLRDLTQPFTSENAPSLAGKPKLFFIQACQGSGYQRGSLPYVPKPKEPEENPSSLEDDAGPVQGETVPSLADFLLGMATVPDCKSFRSTVTGSIYIQELCKQLRKSAENPDMDDILSVLTRVNRNVSKGEFLRHKQMPEPKYTLTKKLVLRYV